MKKHRPSNKYKYDRNPWIALRKRMIEHGCNTLGSGYAKALAVYLGVHPSYIHRWLCPICEHDLEPRYSMGILIEKWLSITPKYVPPENKFSTLTKHTCVICKQHTEKEDQTSGTLNGKRVWVHQTCLIAFSKI